MTDVNESLFKTKIDVNENLRSAICIQQKMWIFWLPNSKSNPKIFPIKILKFYPKIFKVRGGPFWDFRVPTYPKIHIFPGYKCHLIKESWDSKKKKHYSQILKALLSAIFKGQKVADICERRLKYTAYFLHYLLTYFRFLHHFNKTNMGLTREDYTLLAQDSGLNNTLVVNKRTEVQCADYQNDYLFSKWNSAMDKAQKFKNSKTLQ